MFGWLRGKKTPKDSNEPLSNLSDAKQRLLAQMRDKRAEIGEEELQKITNKLNAIKQQIRHDIDHDEKKRDRLLDEIRGGLG